LAGEEEAFLAWTYFVDPSGYIHLRALAHEGIGKLGDGVLNVDLDQDGQALLARFHLHAGLQYVRRGLKAPPGSLLASYCERSFAAIGASDMLALTSVDPTRSGCIVGLLRRASAPLHPNVRAHWRRLSAHITAAQRLRSKLAAADLAAARLERAEAVLAPDGAVSHATGEAKSRRARDALRAGLRAMERARGPLRQQSSVEALETWRGLVAGRWSLVDHFDSDGRRYVVAHRNAPEVADPRGLTARERQIAGYADLGRSNKEIAYELGLSQATVAVHLARARSKLTRLRQT
jgi:DNA-binding NarL/FixJ family response regulator